MAHKIKRRSVQM